MDIEKIGNLWIQKVEVRKVLEKYDIPQEFFLKHFGYKVLKHIDRVDKAEADINSFPIMYIFAKFFSSKKIFFHDIESICLQLKDVFRENFDEDKAIEYEYIIKDKLESIREDIEFENPFVLNANLLKDKDRLKDIRFASNNDLSSTDLESLLDDIIYAKIELFQEQLDDLIFIVDSLECKSSKEVVERLPEIISKYIIFKNLVSSMGLFPIIEKSFDNLIKFLESLNQEILEDFSKRELLLLMLDGLNSDIAKWLETVFIKKEAEDVYYFDASFANNCLEIELQIGNKDIQEEKKEIDEMFVKDNLNFVEV